MSLKLCNNLKWGYVTYVDAYIIIVVVYIFGLLHNVGLQLFFTLVLHIVLPIILGQALLYEASSELHSNCNNLLHISSTLTSSFMSIWWIHGPYASRTVLIIFAQIKANCAQTSTPF